MRFLGDPPGGSSRLGFPCLARTDLAEILWTLARSDVPLRGEAIPALQILQRKQLEKGRWRREAPVPASLPIDRPPRPGSPSRWVTLKSVTALMRYAVEAGLPRMFPQKPFTRED
jgi:hypothetical protein